MPHLIFLNRYWRVAGDELFLPAICTLVGRIFWTSLMVTVLVIALPKLLNCDGGVIIAYLIFSIASFILTIVFEIGLMRVSLRGSIIETEKRSGLNFYLKGRSICGVIQFFAMLYGLLTFTLRSTIPCDEEFDGSNLNRIFVGIVVFSQLADVCALLCCCYLFKANKISKDGNKNEDRDDGDGDDQHDDEDWANGVWENRCKKFSRSLQICTCNLFGGGNIFEENYEEVGKVLTQFFHHDGFLDVVPSDVVAGMVLVRVDQRNRRRASTIRFSRGNSLTASSSSYQHANSISISSLHAASAKQRTMHALQEESGSATAAAPSSAADEGSSAGEHSRERVRSTELSHMTASTSRNVSASERGKHEGRTESPINGGEAVSDGEGKGEDDLLVPVQSSEIITPGAGLPRHEENNNSDNGGSIISPAPPLNSRLGSQSRSCAGPLGGDEGVAAIVHRKLVDFQDMKELAMLEEVARCSVYALAIYTHLILIYMRPCTGVCSLCKMCVMKRRGCGFGVGDATWSGQVRRNRSAGGADGDEENGDFQSGFCGRFQRVLCCSHTGRPKNLGIAAGASRMRAGLYRGLRLGSAACCALSRRVCCLSRDGLQQRSHRHYKKRDYENMVEGDNACGSHFAGLSVIAEQLKHTELVYVSFRNDTTHKPYAIYLDHGSNGDLASDGGVSGRGGSGVGDVGAGVGEGWGGGATSGRIVITIRGTLSLEDCVTDAVVEPQEMTAAGEQWGFDGRGRWAHGGMLKAALNIRRELEETGVLRMFYGQEDYSVMAPAPVQENIPRYVTNGPDPEREGGDRRGREKDRPGSTVGRGAYVQRAGSSHSQFTGVNDLRAATGAVGASGGAPGDAADGLSSGRNDSNGAGRSFEQYTHTAGGGSVREPRGEQAGRGSVRERIGPQAAYGSRSKPMGLSAKAAADMGIEVDIESQEASMSTPLNKFSAYSHYPLIVTGHSLGAGTAALLTMCLVKQYPCVRCIGFGTPGSVVDEQTCRDYEGVITSVVLGNDLVPRLSFPSLCRLRNKVLEAICRAKKNKMEIVLRALVKTVPTEYFMHPSMAAAPDSDFKRSIISFKAQIQAKLDRNKALHLCLPGRVLHLAKKSFSPEEKRKWCGCGKLLQRREFMAVDADLSDFRDIDVSTTMGADHLPDQYCNELHRLLHTVKTAPHTL